MANLDMDQYNITTNPPRKSEYTANKALMDEQVEKEFRDTAVFEEEMAKMREGLRLNQDMLENKDVDKMVADWDPTTPKSNISQEVKFMSTPRNIKRKRVKGHRSYKVREIRVENEIEMKFEVPNHEKKVESDT